MADSQTLPTGEPWVASQLEAYLRKRHVDPVFTKEWAFQLLEAAKNVIEESSQPKADDLVRLAEAAKRIMRRCVPVTIGTDRLPYAMPSNQRLTLVGPVGTWTGYKAQLQKKQPYCKIIGNAGVGNHVLLLATPVDAKWLCVKMTTDMRVQMAHAYFGLAHRMSLAYHALDPEDTALDAAKKSILCVCHFAVFAAMSLDLRNDLSHVAPYMEPIVRLQGAFLGTPCLETWTVLAEMTRYVPVDLNLVVTAVKCINIGHISEPTHHDVVRRMAASVPGRYEAEAAAYFCGTSSGPPPVADALGLLACANPKCARLDCGSEADLLAKVTFCTGGCGVVSYCSFECQSANAASHTPRRCQFMRRRRCEVCASPFTLKKCGRCMAVWYCSQKCQADGWLQHKGPCRERARAAVAQQ